MYTLKKQQLNKRLLHLHIILANSLNNSRLYVQNAFEELQPEDGCKSRNM